MSLASCKEMTTPRDRLVPPLHPSSIQEYRRGEMIRGDRSFDKPLFIDENEIEKEEVT